jgi:hypothetical protein
MATAGPSSKLDSSILERIGNNSIKSAETKESINVSELWKDSDVVIMFLRRFG